MAQKSGHEATDTMYAPLSQTNAENYKQNTGPSQKPTWWSKTYGFFGFNKGYNLPLWIIFGGAMLGFSLARLENLNLDVFALPGNAAPGEWYWYNSGFRRIGILMHLATVCPAGILMIWQFVPIIRHKFILFHRINGYTVIVLLLVGIAGALMIARRSFGGAVVTQTGIGLLAILIVGSIGMAYYNIKRLQTDQHRAWVLRVTIYYGVIITLRLIMIISVQILPLVSDYYIEMSCSELVTLLGPTKLKNEYPQCYIKNGTTDGHVVTRPANFDVIHPDPSLIATGLHAGFSTGLWLALVTHLVGVEIYLKLTPAESERLRNVSYKKQLEAGFKNPGRAGLVVERWGDAEKWQPHDLS